nr:MAG TPA: hypothetical protein [Caudoviricetes sp.]
MFILYHKLKKNQPFYFEIFVQLLSTNSFLSILILYTLY